MAITRADIRELEKKIEAKHKAKIEAANAEKETDLVSLKRVASLLSGDESDESQELLQMLVETGNDISAKRQPKGFVKNAVSEALTQFSGKHFSWVEVKDFLNQRGHGFESGSVRQACSNLVESNKLKIVQQGKGRRPTYYETVANGSQNGHSHEE